MNHPPPSDRTHAKGGPPVVNPGLSAGDRPRTQLRETNPIAARFGFHPSQTIPHCAKRTVRQVKLVQFSRSNPARSKVSRPAGMNMYV